MMKVLNISKKAGSQSASCAKDRTKLKPMQCETTYGGDNSVLTNIFIH